MLSCGHSMYQTQHIHIQNTNHLTLDEMNFLRKYMLRFLFAGLNGCANGCASECARELNNDIDTIPIEYFKTLHPPEDYQDDETLDLYLYSGYLGRVNTRGNILDRYCKLGDQFIRVKIIDAQQHELDMRRDYSIMDLVSLDAVVVDLQENEYMEYCKLLAYTQILDMEQRAIPERDIINSFIELLADRHSKRAKEEYPSLFTETETLAHYKFLYHTFLKKMCAIDVFFNVYHYFLFLYETLDILSVNNLNTIICVVNVEGLENAYWTGQYAVFGNGEDLFYPLASIDVIGHEMSHGLVEGTAGLMYRGESGALNESFADIFGSMFEMYMYKKFNQQDKNELYGNNDWYIGEDIVKSGIKRNLRNMVDPHKSYNPQPIAVDDIYYVDPSSQYDHGGVHVNSGIPNHCFYSISSNTDPITTLQMFYRCLCALSSTSKFKDFAQILLHESESDIHVRRALENAKLISPPRRRLFFGLFG